MYFALLYDTVKDFTQRRQPYREAHLAAAQRAYKEGRLILGGAFNPADGALLVFNAASASEAEEFAKNDPYVIHGLVTAWHVREWTVVIGGEWDNSLRTMSF